MAPHPLQHRFDALSDDAKYVYRAMHRSFMLLHLAAGQITSPKAIIERFQYRSVVPVIEELEGAGFIYETGAEPGTQYQINMDLHDVVFWPVD